MKNAKMATRNFRYFLDGYLLVIECDCYVISGLVHETWFFYCSSFRAQALRRFHWAVHLTAS